MLLYKIEDHQKWIIHEKGITKMWSIFWVTLSQIFLRISNILRTSGISYFFKKQLHDH